MARNLSFFIVIGFALAMVTPTRGTAQPQTALFTRIGLGAGYGGVGSEVGDDGTNSVGYALAWDGAFGAFVHRAIALHFSTFGHYQPNSVTKRDQVPRERGPSYVQNVGAGFTLTPPRDFRRAPRLRPFLSGSLGVSIVNDGMYLETAAGFGGQLIGGFELRVSAGLRIGLALQGSYTGKYVGDDAPPFRNRPISAGHGAGLLTFTYDTRARTR